MQMSDMEILQRWNNALDKNAHVEILADLNAVSELQMREKLLELGAEGLPELKSKRKKRKQVERAPIPKKMDEQRAMELYREGLCDLDISETLGVSKVTVCKWRNMMRLTPNPQPKRRTTLRDEDAMALYKEGLCDLDIAERLDVGKNTVADWRKRKGLKCHRQRPGFVAETAKAEPETAAAANPANGEEKRREEKRRAGRGCPVGEDAPVERRDVLGVEGLLRIAQRLQEAYPQAEVVCGGRNVRDVRVVIDYAPDGTTRRVEMDLILEENV